MKYYGYLVVAGTLLFNDHRRHDTLGDYRGGALCYSTQRIMVTPCVERNGSIERFWELKHLPASEIEFPESVDEVVKAIETDARARQCHLVWPSKKSNVHDFDYAMRNARALVKALCRREGRDRFSVIDPSALYIGTVPRFDHSCAKYQKAEKEAKKAESDATEQ